MAKWLRPRGWLVAGLLGLAVFGWLHSVPTFPDPDAYYHGRMAQLAWEGRLPNALPQAWYTELRTQFYDQHLAYHYVLAPFVAALGIPLGLKLASALLGGVAVAATYAVARSLGASQPWVAVAISLATPAWLYRLGLVKVTPLALALLLVGLTLAYRRRALALGMLAAAFTYTYIGFALLPLVVSVLLFVDWLARKSDSRGRLVTVAAAWLGSGLAFVINPDFPQNVQQFISQFWAIGVVGYTTVGVAGEWTSVTPGWLLRYAPVATLCLAVAVAAAVASPRRRAAAGLAAVALCAFLATAKSRRYVEYAAPLIAVAAAVAIPLGRTADAFRDWWRQRWSRAIAAAAATVFLAGAAYGAAVTRQSLNKLFPASGFGGACDWLQQNVEPGTLVFNVNWGEWPLLFSCRDDLRYAAGLDMRFMARAYPQLAERYQRVARGQLAGPELVETIRRDFGAELVVVTENNTTTAASLASAPGATRVYGDPRVEIYEVR